MTPMSLVMLTLLTILTTFGVLVFASRFRACSCLRKPIDRVFYVICPPIISGLHYALQEKNPLFQIFYATIVGSCQCAFIYYAWPLIMSGIVPYYHIYGSAVCMVSTVLSWVAACMVEPGIITPDNVEGHLAAYPPGDLYRPSECPTCELKKPARSKHCPVCHVCVAKFDHHCQWLNQCVGRDNYRCFLVFLALHVWMCWYATILISSIFFSIIERDNLWKANFVNTLTREKVAPSVMTVFRYLHYRHTLLMGMLLLAVVMGFVLLAFFLNHIWLAARNITTNESYKYDEFKRMGPSRYHKAMIDARNRRAKFEPSKASEVRAEMSNGTPPSAKPTQAPEKVAPRREGVSSSAERVPHVTSEDNTKREAVNAYTKGWSRNLLEVFFQTSVSTPQDSKKTSRRRKRKKTN